MAVEDQFGLLVELRREAGLPLRAQLERGLRAAVRSGRLHPGTRLPSSRALAAQLGVSRGVVVEAYAQLVAEGYLTARQGDGTRVAAAEAARAAPERAGASPRPPRYDFSLGLPDLSAFPRAAWLAAMRRALRQVPDARLGHPDPQGLAALRTELAAYLGRVRGVVTGPERVVVCTGFWQGLRVALAALAARGARRLAMEDPSFFIHRWIVGHAGLEAVPVPVDAKGLVVDRLAETDADAVLVTPAHQFPTGVVMAPRRRAALLEWAEGRDAVVIEDDYDAEYRYDRAAVRALQGLDPARVVYAGSTSKTLAPALRMGWLVVPERLLDAVAEEKFLADQGSARIEQHALADFIARGELDRHLRRMRLRYRARRDLLIDALANAIPDARVQGIAAGLHVTVRLRGAFDEGTLREAARARRVELSTLSDYTPGAFSRDPVLLVGYAQVTEAAMAAGVRKLAAVVASARTA